MSHDKTLDLDLTLTRTFSQKSYFLGGVSLIKIKFHKIRCCSCTSVPL